MVGKQKCDTKSEYEPQVARRVEVRGMSINKTIGGKLYMGFGLIMAIVVSAFSPPVLRPAGFVIGITRIG